MSQSQTSPSVFEDTAHEQEYTFSRLASATSIASEVYRSSLTSTNSSLTHGLRHYSTRIDQPRFFASLGESERESMYGQAGVGLGISGGIGDGIGGSLGTLVLGGFRKKIKKKGGSELGRASRKQRSSYDGTESFATISSYDGGTTTKSAATEVNGEEEKVEAWLQRGKLDPHLPDSSSTSQSITRHPSTPPTARYALSIFPPASPTTGLREYSPPVSPMNNGRDAYGNHIPTDVQNYSTIQPSISSPVLGPIAEEFTSNSTSMPNMRGGGGWWNALSIGKEPSVTDEPNHLSRLGMIQHRAPVQGLRTASTMGIQDHRASEARFGDRSSQAKSSTRAAARTKGSAPVATDYWSDESDNEQQPFKQYSEVSRRRHETYGRLAAPALYRTPSRDSISTLQLETELHHVSRTFLAPIERPASPLSEINFDPRAHKRWDQGLATPPPGREALPPPPPPKPTKPMSDSSSAIGSSSKAKQRYHYPQSVAQSHDGDTYDLQSLQSLELGESVSVAGRPWRQNRFAARRQGIQITPEQYEAAQRSARVEFRPLCQDVMSRYNADMSRSRRAYESDQISPEQYKIQVDFNEKNKRQALKHSADQSGYVILEDESSIFRAINTPDGFAIYHDPLNTTNPVLWQNLIEQLRKARTLQSPTPKSRESTFDQARHAVGKMARFVLATPSDPELKTFSTRMKYPDEPTAYGMFLSLMDPMTAGMLTSGAETESGSAMREKEKAKAKATVKGKGKAPAIEPEAIDMQNFGAATHSGLTGTTVLNNGRWTTVPGKNRQSYARNTVPDPVRRHSHEVGTTVVSAETMWPEGDSQGVWQDVSRPVGSRLRGGAGKAKSKKSKFAWFNASMAQAMLLHG